MKASLPKGTRDFLPEEVYNRNFIFQTIKNTFQLFGYDPIETPAMESLETLSGKYGDEGEKLLFKILNNGDYLARADQEALAERDTLKLTPSISKRGLRYDLTVPFTRFVVMHQHELSFPFKRYQVQPVWRADRPQKGRYQEFYQCDADVVGSDSLIYEAEFVEIYDNVFHQLQLPVVIQLNNRKILQGIAEHFEIADQFIPMTVIIDKLDKIGWEKVMLELEGIGLTKKQQQEIKICLEADIDTLEIMLNDVSTGIEGIREIRFVLDLLQGVNLKNELKVDFALARGLGYYTGCIFEVKAKSLEFGSLGGGGRYADLTAMFGLKDMPGVGISFGAERIYDVMQRLELISTQKIVASQAILLPMMDHALPLAYRTAHQLRQIKIACEVYPSAAKMKKQLKYVDQKNIPFAIIIGSEELNQKQFSLKDMTTGEQKMLQFEKLVDHLKSHYEQFQ